MEKRTQYTASFKKRAIILSEDIGNSSAARRLGINESTIRGWQKNRDRIFQAAPTRKAFRGPKHGRRPELEKLADFIEERCGQFLPVNTEVIQLKARELAREAGLSRNALKASRSWLQKFMRRAEFSLHKRTSICQKLSAEYEEKLLAFQRHVIALRKNRNYLSVKSGTPTRLQFFWTCHPTTSWMFAALRKCVFVQRETKKLW